LPVNIPALEKLGGESLVLARYESEFVTRVVNQPERLPRCRGRCRQLEAFFTAESVHPLQLAGLDTNLLTPAPGLRLNPVAQQFD
jgi:hypothetical protein